MKERARAAVVAGLSRLLERQGYEGAELDLARRDAVDWAKARVGRVRTRRRVVGGQEIVVTAIGRAQLRPIERLLAGPDEVTVEVLVSAISAGTERAEWLRQPNLQRELPYSPGYSGVGRVLASGPGPHAVEPGALVAVARLRHASVATVPAAYVHRVPDGVSPEAAALLYLAMISGWGVERADIAAGERLCIIGAGPIGALAQRLASLRDPGPITVVARSRRREAAARATGAADFRTIDDDLADLVAPVVIEASGDPGAIATAVTAVAPGGTIVLLGSPGTVSDAVPLAEIQRKRVRVVGAHISSLAKAAKTMDHDPFRRVGDEFLAALGDGRLAVDDLVGDPVDPREARLFYSRLARGEVDAGHFDWTRLPREVRVREPHLLDRPALPARAPSLAPVPFAPAATGGRLRFSVVGCGDIGHKNARAIARAANADLVLSYDTAPGLAERTAAAMGGTVATELEQALDPAKVDAVFLSVPHDLHTPLIEHAAAAGVHVVVEKPLALDLASAQRAADAAARAGVVLSVCLPFRYEAPLVAARALVQAGAIGDLTGAAVVFHDDQPDSYWTGGFSGRVTSDWRMRPERAGGGILIMSLIHQIDFLHHVLGVPIDTVSAVSLHRPGEDVEDTVAMTITFAERGVGSILGSASTRGRPDGRFEVWGDVGTIRLVPEAMAYSERAVGGLVPGRWWSLPPDDGSDVRATFVERFVDAVMAGRPPDVTARDGLLAQAVVEAGYRSIERGAPVRTTELLGESRR